jgi:predicted membrane-bound spermidine synthase
MAVIWRAEQDAVKYEVRQQGRTLRLFANGVQHSEYHPDRLFTGSVWDLLWLPVFFADPARVRRILILGLGGGSVVAPLKRFAAAEKIVAVDLDPLHIQVARQFFGVDAAGVETHCMDAREFVEHYQGEPFDLVIEDLFAPHDTSVSRVFPANSGWCTALARLVSRDGYLVMNYGDWSEYRDSWAAGERGRKGWSERFRLSTEDCHNAVIVSSRRSTDSATLRRHLVARRETAAALASGDLAYQIRRLA